jgi:N-acetylglucosamine-6-phosphate deacetylase
VVPARIAGVSDRKGTIGIDYDADLVVLDERLEIERVVVRGDEVGNVR